MKTNLIRKGIMIFLIIVTVLSVAGCSVEDGGVGENQDIDWTRGIYCEATQEFLSPGMIRDEVSQILGDGEKVMRPPDPFYVFRYRDGNLYILYSYETDEAIGIFVDGEGFLVFGLSYGSPMQEMLDTMRELREMGYVRRRTTNTYGDEKFYGYDNLTDFGSAVNFTVDLEEERVINIAIW